MGFRVILGIRSRSIAFVIALFVIVIFGAAGRVLAATTATTHYIAANGSDSNNGLSTTSPWLHAPGMPACSGACASYTPQPGDKFIFRGGDTWHFGNSSASPYTGGTWDWQWNGSSSNSIYIGVDTSWFSGASWSRPILSADNPLTPHPGAMGDYVASCSYQVGGSNVLVSFNAQTNVIYDNFEMTRLCQNSTTAPFGHDLYTFVGNGGAVTLEHLYLHGWTHINFATCGGPVACENLAVFQVGQGQSHVWYNVVDGSDSDPGGIMVFPPGASMWDVAYNVFRYASQGIGTACHLLHDNLYDHFESMLHANVYECVGEPGGVGAFYNNVFRNLCTDAGGCTNAPLVNIWPNPPVGSTDYWFNNVIYNVGTAGSVQNFDLGQNGSNQGTLKIFNNTWESTQNSVLVNDTYCTSAHPFAVTNNYYITDASSPYVNAPSSCQGTATTERTQNHATANNYTDSSSYGYYPKSNSPTIGAGTNLAGTYCAELSTAAASDATLTDAAAACLNDTSYGVSYNATNHTANYPARTPVSRGSTWDQGAYQYNSQNSSPSSPTGLTAVVQ